MILVGAVLVAGFVVGLVLEAAKDAARLLGADL